jgi:transposase
VAIEDYFRKVYVVEREITTLREQRASCGETLPPEVVSKLRTDKPAPIMRALKKWVDELLLGVPPKSALGKTLSYTTSQWTKIAHFFKFPDMPADNNYAEQQVKSFVTGRRAWVFCDSKVGATASGNLYSLVMTACKNGVEPFAYLSYVFEQLPIATTVEAGVEALKALLPWSVKPLL